MLGARPIEDESRVGGLEGVVAADLNRPVSHASDDDVDDVAPRVQLDEPRRDAHGARWPKSATAVGKRRKRVVTRDRKKASVEGCRKLDAFEGDGMVDRDELRAVGKSPFDLNLDKHLRNAIHHVHPAEKSSAEIHELGDGLSVANQLEKLGRDQRDGLRVVQTNAPCQALLCNNASSVEEQFIDVSRCKVHRLRALPIAMSSSPLSSERVVSHDVREGFETRSQCG